MTADLVIQALKGAIARGLVKAEAVIHSDRGSQYAATDFRRLLEENCFRQSMSGKGNCYDNAQAESFFSASKRNWSRAGCLRQLNKPGQKFSVISKAITTGSDCTPG